MQFRKRIFDIGMFLIIFPLLSIARTIGHGMMKKIPFMYRVTYTHVYVCIRCEVNLIKIYPFKIMKF